MNKRNLIVLATVVAALAACGGNSYEPDESVRVVNSASYEDKAPAGSLVIGVGEGKAERDIVRVTHVNRNERPARLGVSAAAQNVHTVGAVTAAGLRWEVRASGLVVASGKFSPDNAGTVTFDIDVERGVTTEVAVVAFVEAPGAAGVAWDGASVTASAK